MFKQKEKRLAVVLEIVCNFFGEVSLVHIYRNARGRFACVYVVLYDVLLFCFIQEANLWPRTALLFFLRYYFDIFITLNFKQAYYKSFLSYIAHSFFSAFSFCISFKTIHDLLKLLWKYTEFSNILPKCYWV